MVTRLFRHLALPGWWWRRKLPAMALSHIEAAVAEAEASYAGEIRVAVETSLDWLELLRNKRARARALEVFAQLQVWDTEDNNGVLLYVLLADRDVEIVADRGIARRVSDAEWEGLCRDMEALFRAGRHEDALVSGVRGIGELCARHHPRDAGSGNQLPNRPALIK